MSGPGGRITPGLLAEALGMPPPTAEQAAVIAAPPGPTLVVAGAGAGKTETMAARVLWMIANGLVEPDAVLGLTFTRKAAQQLTTRIRTRLARLAGAPLLREIDPSGRLRARLTASEPEISTYHSYAGRLLGEHGLLLPVEPNATLLTETQLWQLAHRVVTGWDGDLDTDRTPVSVTEAVLALSGQLAEHLVEPEQLAEAHTELEKLILTLPRGPRQRGGPSRELLGILEVQHERVALLPLVQRLREELRRRGALDFGAQMSLAARLAAEHPEVGAAERDRFRLVLLDEYQDTGHAQRILLAALFGDLESARGTTHDAAEQDSSPTAPSPRGGPVETATVRAQRAGIAAPDEPQPSDVANDPDRAPSDGLPGSGHPSRSDAPGPRHESSPGSQGAPSAAGAERGGGSGAPGPGLRASFPDSAGAGADSWLDGVAGAGVGGSSEGRGGEARSPDPGPAAGDSGPGSVSTGADVRFGDSTGAGTAGAESGDGARRTGPGHGSLTAPGEPDPDSVGIGWDSTVGESAGAGVSAASRRLAVTAVGDPMQSIYGWRGASAANLPRFATDFPSAPGVPAPILPLLTSWRNPPEALALANLVAEPLRDVEGGVAVDALRPRPDATEGTVALALTDTVADERDWVAERIAAEWEARADAGAPPPTSAVLVRRNADAAPLAEALRERGLPVEIVGLGGLLATPEVADVVATLRLIADPAAGSAAMRILTGARWRLGVTDLAALSRRARELSITRPPDQAAAITDSATLADALRTVAPEPAEQAGLADAIADPGAAEQYSEAGYRRIVALGQELAALRDRSGQTLPELVSDVERTIGVGVETQSRRASAGGGAGREHLDAFADVVADYASDHRASLPGLLTFLAAAEEVENGLEPGEVEVARDRVQVLTVHAAKGLEWEVVAVPHVTRGVFPSGAAAGTWLGALAELPTTLRGDRQREGADGVPVLDLSDLYDRSDLDRAIKQHKDTLGRRRLDEERRLFYVALTRTERALFISAHHWAETGSAPKGPSDFLLDLKRAAEHPDSMLSTAVRIDHWADPPATDAVNPFTDDPASAAWPRDPLGKRRTAVQEGAALVLEALRDLPPEPDPRQRDATDAAQQGVPEHPGTAHETAVVPAYSDPAQSTHVTERPDSTTDSAHSPDQATGSETESPDATVESGNQLSLFDDPAEAPRTDSLASTQTVAPDDPATPPPADDILGSRAPDGDKLEAQAADDMPGGQVPDGGHPSARVPTTDVPEGRVPGDGDVAGRAPDGGDPGSTISAADAPEGRAPVGDDPEGRALAGADPWGRAPDADPEGWAADVDALLAEHFAAEDGVRDVELPGQLPATALVEMRSDPGKLAARLRRPLPYPPSPFARRGTAFHAWLQQWFGSARLLGLDELPGAADSRAADADLVRLQEAFLSSPWADRNPAEVEVAFETSLAGTLIRGRMDAVFAEPGGRWLVVDWKTGAEPTRSEEPAVAMQLAVYRLAWARLLAARTGADEYEILEKVGAAFHYVRTGRTIAPSHLPGPEELTEFLAAAAPDRSAEEPDRSAEGQGE